MAERADAADTRLDVRPFGDRAWLVEHSVPGLSAG